jgi:hypothetical protein
VAENLLGMRDERESGRFPGYPAGENWPYLKAAVREIGRYFKKQITEPVENTLDAARSGAYGLRAPSGGLYSYYDPMAPLGAAMLGLGAGYPGRPVKTPGTVDIGLLGGVAAKNKKSGLSLAEKMAKEGAHVEDIWQKTGWIKGKEGKWRFEIDDSKMKQKLVKSEHTTLGEVIEHPDLFKQYPELKKVKVELSEYMGDKAQYDPASNTITVAMGKDVYGEGYYVPDKSTLIHEIQHAIQETEGFAKGGSPDYGLMNEAKRVYDELAKPIREQYELAKANKNTALADELQKQLMMELPEKANMIAYRRLHGEFESRDSAFRLKWGAEKRKTVKPYSSEVEPAGGWIVK